MRKPKWDSVLLVIVTIAVLCFVAYKTFDSGMLRRDFVRIALLQKEIEWASAIEGRKIDDLFKDDSGAAFKFRRSRKSGRGKFVVILSDSSCKPCFGTYIKEFVLGLKEQRCTFDRAQWIGVFGGEDTTLGIATFRGVFGAAAGYVKCTILDRRFLLTDDALILFVAGDNTIVACSRVAKPLESIRSSFVRRAANALLAAELD